MIRTIVADDHHLVREGIRMLLEKSEDIQVVGEAENGEEAVQQVLRLAPDVLVTDISMPGLNGLHAIRKLREAAPDTQIVVLTMYSSEMMVHEALRSGARGYLLKDSLSGELLTAVRAAARGATYFSPSVADTILGERHIPGQADSPGPADLTPRERQVLQYLCDGLTNSEIASKFTISVKTVERHRANLMTKLGARNVVELIRSAVRYGLVSLDP